MTIAHHLRGYDKHTEVLWAEYNIAASLLPSVRQLVTPPADDPDLIQPYALNRMQAAELAATIGVMPDLHSLDFFVEADEDWQTVAAKRDALRAVG